MSLISKFKQVPQHLPHGTAKRTFTGVLVDKGERYGGSFLLGYLKAKYRDKFSYKGVGYDTVAGVAGLLGSVVLNVMSGGRSALAPHFERLGDVGVSAHMLQWGAELGADHAGYSTKVVHQGAGPAKTLPAQQVVGAIPQAKPGTVFLTDQDIASALAKRT